MSYLQESSIQTQIGAQQLYQECADAPSEMFDTTGDCRPATVMYMCIVSCQLTNPPDARSFLSTLSTVVQSGIQVLIWAGDAGRNSLLSITLSDSCSRSFFTLSTHADWICNTAGVQAVVAKIQFAESTQFNSASLAPYTVNGVQYGTFKTAGKLSFLNVFEAGHEVPAYQPIVALQAFIQTISQQPLSST